MKTRLSQVLRIVAVPAVGVIALAATTGLTHAQTPPPTPQPITPAILPAPGGPGTNPVQIWTNASDYTVGQSIQYCITVPYPGQVVIWDHQPGLAPHIVNDFYESSTFDCFYGTVTPPVGYETLRVVFHSGSGAYSDLTGFWTHF